MISVCIATHNGEEYIIKQLKSILCQLSINDEIIISDDGSKDKTIEVINKIKDERIKIIHLSHKQDFSRKKLSSFYYASANFYNALLAAKGDIIFLSDQDDIWPNNKVELFLKQLKTNDIVCSNFSIIDENDMVIKERYYKEGHFKNLNIKMFLKELPFRGCCLAFKRNVLNSSIPFPKNLFLHDCWIGLNGILNGFRYVYIDTPLLYYRRHSENVSSMHSPNSLAFKIAYRLKLLYQIYKLKFQRKYIL